MSVHYPRDVAHDNSVEFKSVFSIYSVSPTLLPPWGLVAIFPKRLGIFQRNFACLLCVLFMLHYKFLFSYLQLWRSCAIFSVTTHRVRKMSTIGWNTLAFSDIFPKQLGIFSPNFTHLFNVHTYSRMQSIIYLQLWRVCAIFSATTRRGFRSMVDILSTLWWSRLTWHNFVNVADNWKKNCSPA